MSDQGSGGGGCLVISIALVLLFILCVTGVPCNGDHYMLGCDSVNGGCQLAPLGDE